MVKLIKSEKTNFIRIHGTLYIKVPRAMHNDTAFPFSKEKDSKLQMIMNMTEDGLSVERK